MKQQNNAYNQIKILIRTTDWVYDNLVNCTKELEKKDGYVEEYTGLNELEFIETRRYWITDTYKGNTEGRFNILNLVEGDKALIESPTNKFEPFVVNYIETFILPASLGEYTIKPYGDSERVGIIKAYVRGC